MYVFVCANAGVSPGEIAGVRNVCVSTVVSRALTEILVFLLT